MKLKFFGEIVAMLLIVGGLYMIISSTTVHAANRPRFERLLEEETGDDNFVHFFEVWHDKDSGQEFTCVFGAAKLSGRPASCFPTGRNWK